MAVEMIKDIENGDMIKTAYDELHAPDSWKQDVILKMKEEEKKNECKKETTQTHRLIRFATGTAILCAAALCLFLILPKGAPITTKMEDGIYYENIELKNGEIHFVSNRVAISISPNAGAAFNTALEAEENPTEVLLTESGGTITFEKTQKSKLPEIAESNWSYIGEQPIYVTVLKTEPVRYQAIYETDGETYELIGEGVTQREFIDELYRLVKK
ncbi:MAG: hypothetical protein IJ274_07110 [Lachnospiraceae bacterium]|nr:hypothetical protein [Lachnospiraceae bacterium]